MRRKKKRATTAAAIARAKAIAVAISARARWWREEEVAERSRAITTPIITTMATAILAAASIIAAAAAIPNRRSLYLRRPLSRSRSKVVGKVQASRLRLRRRSRQVLQVVRRIRITSITGRVAASRMQEQAARPRMERILVRVQVQVAHPRRRRRVGGCERWRRTWRIGSRRRVLVRAVRLP